MRFDAGALRGLLLVVAGGSLLGTTGCQSPAAERQRLSSPSPIERARAAVRLAEGGDATSVHKLVDLLEDADPAVRLYSILALERLCGEDFGYRYYGSESERDRAVQRWRAAIREGSVVMRSGPTAELRIPERAAVIQAPAGAADSETRAQAQ